nr:MAG TPA: protein of unknown function (DUF5026) [Caudoviricetes sp.]
MLFSKMFNKLFVRHRFLLIFVIVYVVSIYYYTLNIGFVNRLIVNSLLTIFGLHKTWNEGINSIIT